MRQLTEQELAAARKKHLDVLKSIDDRAEEKKNAAAIYNEEIKIFREQELKLRRMLITEQAEPEQLSILD
jgi:hypothetical protein